MSYCIDCGVELDSSAKKCALCGTAVNNPDEKENPDERFTPFSSELYIPEEGGKFFSFFHKKASSLCDADL